MHLKAFDEIKAIMSKETMLYCPKYKLPFLMLRDASEMQLGAHALQVQATKIDYTNVDEGSK